MSRPFPPLRSRPRSHTAKALEIVRLTRRPRANLGGWSLEVRSARSNTSPANATARSGEPTSPRSMAPGARSEAMGAVRGATRQIAEGEEQAAPVTSPDAPGGVPSSPSRRPKC